MRYPIVYLYSSTFDCDDLGATSEAPSRYLCGQHMTSTRYSSGNSILIHFTSDGVIEATGFTVHFEQIDPDSVRKQLKLIERYVIYVVIKYFSLLKTAGLFENSGEQFFTILFRCSLVIF